MTLEAIEPSIKILIFHIFRRRTGMIQMSRRNRSTINKWWFHMGKDVGAILATRRRSLFTTSFPLVGDSILHLVGGSPTYNGAVDSLSPSRNLVNML